MKKIKYLILVITTILVMNCGTWSRFKAKATGYSNECVDGVRYLQFTSGVTVAVDLNGNPLPCK